MRHIKGTDEDKYEEAIPVLLRWSVALSRHGWKRLSAFLFELDLILSGLGKASRQIRKDQARERKLPPKSDRRIISTVVGAGVLLAIILFVATVGGV